MSLGFRLITPPCPHCGNPEQYVVDLDPTHNLCPLWRELGVIDALYESDGKTAADIVDVIEQGLGWLCEDFKSYRRFDSSNGWGTAEDGLFVLWKIYRGCMRYPKATIRVSK